MYSHGLQGKRLELQNITQKNQLPRRERGPEENKRGDGEEEKEEEEFPVGKGRKRQG